LPLRVGNDVATINDVMGVVEILSSRREYTKLNPLIVLLGKGDHQITSSWTDQSDNNRPTTLGITRSNITFVGKGKDTTTINGGFGIRDLENITFKHMTVTNTSNDSCDGICMSNSNVELFDVALKGCRSAGFRILNSTSETTSVATRCEFANSRWGAVVFGSLSSAKFNNCLFNENITYGLIGNVQSTIHLHGEATAIHSNRSRGIFALSYSRVLIHLPSHHNTSYNNEYEDRYTRTGGTITNVEDY